jgi:chemotaxis protein MotB
MAERLAPIIIKKIKKGGGGGHSGGAWKVAYADFVTAMMAFFLLLWLLNSVTQEQLEGISNYFAPASASATKSGSGQVLGGQAVSQPIGSLTQASENSQAQVVDLPPPTQAPPPAEITSQPTQTPQQITEQQAREAVQKKEQEQFDQAVKELNNAISQNENKELAKSLMVENTAEGLRIQVVDQDGAAMFPSGSSQPNDRMLKVLKLVSQAITEMPQNVSITGHTDAKKFGGGESGYTNWELSADRANASRRALQQLGVPADRIVKVVGEADRDPLVAADPDSERNRRIAIVLLRGTGAQATPGAPGTAPPAGAAKAVSSPLPPPSGSGKSNLFPLP